ncbi:hypothetical protein vseg_018183 [Gypsophila vaccaria]
MAMSMRSRGAAAAARRSRSGVRPAYEDFKPTSELKHEEGVDVLLYHLPGFVKEQIRIIAESKGILRVHGERLIANNKWSRFQEEVAVPEDCNLGEIRAKFDDGVLRITMPRAIKKQNNQPQRITEKETNKTHDEEQPSTLPSATQSSTIHEKPQLPKDDSKPTTTSADHKMFYDDKKNVESKEVGNNDGHDVNNLKEKNKMNGRNNNSNDNEEKNGANTNKSNEGYGFTKLKNLTKSQVTRRILDEDRQLLVNMGAAILVIMALGASISLSLGFGEEF